MRFEPNEPEIRKMLDRASRELGQRVQTTLDQVQAQYAGQDAATIRPALDTAWRGINQGAHLTDEQLDKLSGAISARHRVYLDRGHLMIDDGGVTHRGPRWRSP
jgi:hypothetical protein